jgi:hypothetical protein
MVFVLPRLIGIAGGLLGAHAGLNPFSGCTQDFVLGYCRSPLPGLGLVGRGCSPRRQAFFVATHERGRSRLHLATSSRRVIRLESAGESPVSTQCSSNGSGQERPLYIGPDQMFQSGYNRRNILISRLQYRCET